MTIMNKSGSLEIEVYLWSERFVVSHQAFDSIGSQRLLSRSNVSIISFSFVLSLAFFVVYYDAVIVPQQVGIFV